MEETTSNSANTTQPPVDSIQVEKMELEPNVLAALSYAIPLVMGIVIILKERQNRFVRFHAFQSIIFGLCWAGAAAIASSLKVILIGLILSPLVTVAGVALWFFLMWKAYSNIEYQLPYIGKIAHDQANK